MARRRTGAAAALAALVVAAGIPAWAASRSTVALIRTADGDAVTREATTLMRAELTAAGFDVALVDHRPGAETRAEIEATSAALHPIATFAILREGDGASAEVWLSDRVTGKTVIRRVDTGPRPAGASAAAADLALKAVELLRGSLLEIVVDDTRAAPVTAPPPADVARWIAPVVEPRRRSVAEGIALEVGGSVFQTVGGAGPALAPLFRLAVGSRSGFGARATIVGPGLAREVRDGAATASVRQDLLLAEAFVALRPGRRVQPVLAVGAGGAYVDAQGTAVPPDIPDHKAAWAVAGQASAGAAVRMGRWVALIADMNLAYAVPPSLIVIKGVEVTRVGRLALFASVGLTTGF